MCHLQRGDTNASLTEASSATLRRGDREEGAPRRMGSTHLALVFRSVASGLSAATFEIIWPARYSVSRRSWRRSLLRTLCRDGQRRRRFEQDIERLATFRKVPRYWPRCRKEQSSSLIRTTEQVCRRGDGRRACTLYLPQAVDLDTMSYQHSTGLRPGLRGEKHGPGSGSVQTSSGVVRALQGGQNSGGWCYSDSRDPELPSAADHARRRGRLLHVGPVFGLTAATIIHTQ